MASQGPLSGGTFADDTTVGTNVWSTPGNAISSNDVYATATSSAGGSTTHYLKATNFGFTIPAGATIDGIVVGVERNATDAGCNDSSVRLFSGGVFVGANKATATAWPTTDAYEDHGGATDTWAAGLTAADINNTGFGVGVSAVTTASLSGLNIDHIRITVFYTPASGGSQVIVAGI